MNDDLAIHDGGPAFPCDADSDALGLSGMTLRDWFAGQMLNGIIASGDDIPSLEDITRISYRTADAMLIERNKGR